MVTDSNQNIETIDGERNVRQLILDIRFWIFYLWSKKTILIIAGALGAVIGFCYALVKQPIYKATTTFVLEGAGNKGGLSQYASVAAMVGINLGGDAGGLFQGDNILELYKSRKMITQTLLSKVDSGTEELLVDRYIAIFKLREVWKDDPKLSSLDFRSDLESLTQNDLRVRDSVLSVFVRTIRKNVLRVEKPDNKLSIIQVNVSSPDEVFSKAFNDNLVRLVNEFYVQTKTKKTNESIAVLERKVDSVRMLMEGAIYSAARASDITPNLNPTRQTQRVAPIQEAQFSAEATKVMLSQLLQNLELTKINQLQEQPLIQLVDRPVYPLEVERIGFVKGIFIGCLMSVVLMVLLLSFFKWYKDIMRLN